MCTTCARGGQCNKVGDFQDWKMTPDQDRGVAALIDARRLDYYHRLERENIHLTLLEDVARGWDDVESGDLLSVAELKSRYGRGE